jgi:hypothetical protein
MLCSGWGRPLSLLKLNWTFCAIPGVTGIGKRLGLSEIPGSIHAVFSYDSCRLGARLLRLADLQDRPMDNPSRVYLGYSAHAVRRRALHHHWSK